jgi:S-formylglutathione hydrolase FrmB
MRLYSFVKRFLSVFFLFFLSFSTFGQQKIVISSSSLPNPDTAFVFLPQKYHADSLYKTVILLHGWTGNYATWSKYTDLQKLADEYQNIIICPDGFYDSWYINGTTIKYEDFFFQDFIPHIFSNYKINPNYLFITGFSMGGHGAMTLFCKRPTLFKSAGSSSGLFDLRLYPKRFGLPKVIGNVENKELLFQNSTMFWISKLANHHQSFFFDCGTEDILYPNNEEFKKLCESYHLDFKFVAMKGRHDAQYWKNSILLHFQHFNQLK